MENNIDLKYFEIYTNVLGENFDYFTSPSRITINVNNLQASIINFEGIIDDVTDQAICLKLIHNISMLTSYCKTYIEQMNIDTNEAKNILKYNHTYQITLIIGTETVNIESKSGFGFIVYNTYAFAAVLLKFSEAIRDYLMKLINKYDLDELERVTNHLYNTMFVHPDKAISTFIKSNIDFYQDYV